MSANKPDLFKEILNDLDSISGDREGKIRRVYQVGFLAAVLTGILLKDRLLLRAWRERIKILKDKNQT